MLKYSLFENGVDSIKHGIDHFIDNDYKYAIIHIFHGIELLLKESLRRIDPVLIYKNIDELIKEDSYTVEFNKLVTRLENFKLLRREDAASLEKLRINRNRIEHKDISLDKEKAEDMLGESLKYISKYSKDKLGVDLKDCVGGLNWEKIEEIIYSYDERLAKANEEIDGDIPGDKDAMLYEKMECPYCGNETVLYDSCNLTTECYFCHEKVYIFECVKCSGRYALEDERDEQPCDLCCERFMREE